MKAVVFVHGFKAKGNLSNAADRLAFSERYKPIFKEYLCCKNIGLVYIYVSAGIEQFIAQKDTLGPGATITVKQLEAEAEMINALQGTTDRAFDELSKNLNAQGVQFSREQTPRFVFIGIRELVRILRKLLDRNPDLVVNMAGGQGFYGYDSPKFVEAVIRIKRGMLPFAEEHPIIRMDADVCPDVNSIDKLLTQVQAFRNQTREFYLFSGNYRGIEPDDLLNDHAVRMHRYFGPSSPNSETKEPLSDQKRTGAEQFLRDLEQVGAKQLPSGKPPSISGECERMLRTSNRDMRILDRPSQQLISGAGLTMSLAAILSLPPFMNMSYNIVWIDDFLKRVLHEMLGHIALTEVERIPTAKFVQRRHPNGPEDVTDFQTVNNNSEYLQRILRGCLIYATIVNPDGSPGPLARAVEEALRGRLRIAFADSAEFLDGLRIAVEKRKKEVMQLWSSNSNVYKDEILEEWSNRLQNGEIVKGMLLLSAEMVGAQSDLNNCIISGNLRCEFGKRTSLSDSASVSVEETDASWLITDKDKDGIETYYIVEKQEGELKIYIGDTLDGIVKSTIDDAAKYVKLAILWHEYTAEILGLQPEDCYFPYERIR